MAISHPNYSVYNIHILTDAILLGSHFACDVMDNVCANYLVEDSMVNCPVLLRNGSSCMPSVQQGHLIRFEWKIAIWQMRMGVCENGTTIGTYRPMETSINLNKPGIGNIPYHWQLHAAAWMPYLCDYKTHDGSCHVYAVSINLTYKIYQIIYCILTTYRM